MMGMYAVDDVRRETPISTIMASIGEFLGECGLRCPPEGPTLVRWLRESDRVEPLKPSATA